ncbi:MAG TPA: hypothetical protein VGM44_08350 [Polyangiaceae bacterium]|jgi:hypothetical protein
MLRFGRIGVFASLVICAACGGSHTSASPNSAGTTSGGSANGGSAGVSGANSAAGDSGAVSTAIGVTASGVNVDPSAFGRADLSKIAFTAFSQSGTNAQDPQVLSLVPDLVPRTWSQWDTYGVKASDYDFSYPSACQAKGITFVGGLTASVIFQDEMSESDFADEVGRDAANNPVPHNEIVPNAFRGALASPGFRQRLIDVAELQIDGGVDGLFFDEVNSSFIGANYAGDEGFDDHHVADFGRFLCIRHGGELANFDLTSADQLDCSANDPGAGFDYRGYLARIGATAAPLSAANPLQVAWGTTIQNRTDPSAGTFVATYPAYVYFQQIVATVRNYARQKYNKEILVTANGIFPFVDFQSVGLYDYNHEGPGPKGFDWVPLTTDGHFAGTGTFASALENLKAQSKSVQAAVSGAEVPLLLFLDWPTDSINRYYALPQSERVDYVRAFLAETSALGMWFAVPLATTTDTQTASALGMMDSFQALRAFYVAHGDLFRGAQELPDTTVQSSLPTAGTRLVALPDARFALYVINHDYTAGFVPHTGVTVSFPSPQMPFSVTLASPDLAADMTPSYSIRNGILSVTIEELTSSAVIVAEYVK